MKQLLKTSLYVVLLATGIASYAQENSIRVKTLESKDTISKHIYGHFAEHLGRCIYDGIWVGEDSDIPNTRGMRNDILEALKEIDIPVLRWPGGCYADLYQWKDGIGPKEDRPGIINKFWGNVYEDNSFGTHEFLDLCEILGTEAYLAVNMGSGSVEDAYDWIEYVNSDQNGPMAQLRRQNGREKPWNVKFWGIGNENWGCGGNMTAAYYTDLYRRYATYCWVDYRVASGGLNHDLEWTETLMKGTQHMQNLIQGVSYHHYTVCNTWQEKGSATDFDESEWFSTIQRNYEMEENMVGHIKIMEKYDPDNKVALIADEWGNWHDPEPGSRPGFLYQQNTMRDAITASIYLNVFNTHANRVKMANIAQTVNVLQAMLLTEDDQIVKTPTFYVFKMYKVHQDAALLPLTLDVKEYAMGDKSVPAISASASRDSQGIINITLANVDPKNNQTVSITFDTETRYEIVKAEVITAPAMNTYNDFGKAEEVSLKQFDGAKLNKNTVNISMPSKSVVLVSLKAR
jgi:alpha-N-arabinofuranosidase